MNDNEILNLCRKHAKNFLRYKNASFDELVNVAFIMARTAPTTISTKSSIIWALLNHTKYLARADARKSNKAIDPRELVERRELNKASQLTPVEVLNIMEQQSALIKAVLRLSPADRQLIYWYYRDNMTFNRLGKRLSPPCSGVWAREKLKNILSDLRKELKDFEPRE